MNANVGMQYPVYSPITAYTPGTSVTYGTGGVVAEAVSASVSWEREDGRFYGDDVQLDSANGVLGYTIDFEPSGLSDTVRAALLGETLASSEYTINSAKENVHERLQEITQGAGPDVVIEAVGAPVTYQMAVNEVAFTGRVVCIGYAKQDVQFTTKLFVQEELDIRGSRNAQPEDFEGVIRYLEKNNPPYDILISNEVTPEHAEEAMQQWMQAPAKVFRILVKFV